MAIDLMAIQPNVISKDLRSKYVLLSGAPKIGKTEFCTQAPDALILAFEKGTNARPGAMVQPIQSWSEFKQVLRQLQLDEVKAKFSTICIDTVGIAYELAEQFICAQAGVQKIGEIPYGGGYSALSKEFEQSLRKITMLNYGLIMTCHLKESVDDDGNIIGYKPDLNNRCLKVVNGLVDIIGVITQQWNNGESERWIITRSTPTITAGSRFKYLAPKIPFSYDNFCAALAEAIEKEGENGAKIVETRPETQVEILNFADVRAEAQKLWTEILGRGNTDEEKEEILKVLSKKIEIIFGRTLKLSEVMEDQVDLLQLVVLEMREML